MIRRNAATLILNVILLILYVCAGRFGLTYFAFLNSSASAIWPPTGLALAALLLLGYRLWPAILLGAFIVNLLTTPPHEHITTAVVFTDVVIAVGNTLEALAGAFLARRFAHGKLAFERTPDLFRYIALAAIPSTIISATIGVAALQVGPAFPSVWLTWWTGDFVSDLVVAPLLIIFATSPKTHLSKRSLAEALALAVLLGVLSAIIFEGGGPWKILGGRPYALAGLATPLLLWASFRFQQRGAIGAACLMSGLAIAGTLRGVGPFVTENRNDALILLQTFMGVNTLTALVLATVVSERARLDEERLHLLESERAARALAEQANRAKDEFLAILSHELRTPLTPVMLTASLLENDPKLPPQYRNDIHQMRRNVELEAHLIDDLLDLTRVVRGKLQLQLQSCDVHQKLRFAANTCGPRSADFVYDLAAMRHHVKGDPARLQQIFWNLLTNAVKFAPAGSPITIRTSNPVEAPMAIRIEIIDTGVGIPPDALPKLFNAFEQGNATQARKFGGLGLGLSIAKALVEAHHGTITAASPGPGKGATFTVTLPYTTMPQPVVDPHPVPPRPRKAASPLRVLLVEDHEPTMGVMCRLLQDLGHSVATAATAQAAVDLARQAPIDLLISDIGLPDGTGYDLLRRIKSSTPAVLPFKAIAVSGYGMDHDRALSHEAGFAAHLTKPIDLDRLLAAIHQVTESESKAEPVTQ